MRIHETIVLGLDIGIGSIGWVLIEILENGEARILQRVLANGEVIFAAGVRLVDVPEDPKTKELKSKHRRDMRRQRITIRRRAQRMRNVRKFLAEHIYSQAMDVALMHHDGVQGRIGVWQLRREALERRLTDKEFALALIHMAKHRGFFSNSKRDRTSASDTGKMLKAIDEIWQAMEAENAPTLGVYLAGRERQRNRSGMDGKPVYACTPRRDMLEEECAAIFAAQRRLGDSRATPDLCDAFRNIAFHQQPLRSVEHLIGQCAFLEHEKRAPSFSPTAEQFRLAQRLGILRLVAPDGDKRPLTEAERRKAMSLLGKHAKISYAALRKTLNIPDGVTFENLRIRLKTAEGKTDNPETQDIVRRSGACGTAHALFCKQIGRETFDALMRRKDGDDVRLADKISKIISDNDDPAAIRKLLQDIPLSGDVMEKLCKAIGEGDFNAFKGVSNLSLRAMYAVLPHLIACGDYAAACNMAGFDHAKTRKASWRDIRNPLVQHMLREVRRQIMSVLREFRVIPGRVHIETARDFGKSVEERRAIEKGIDVNTKRNTTLRAELAEHFSCASEAVSSDELLRYKLWKEQGGKCCYYMLWSKAGGQASYNARIQGSDGAISVLELRGGTNTVQMDHILPYSRTYDSTFHNLGLCLTAANQNKGNRSPYEWIGREHPQSWHAFSQWVGSLSCKGIKKRNYLLEDFSGDREKSFCERNLHDTRYITRVILGWLREDFYPQHTGEEDNRRRVFARPGALTAFLRKSWSLEGLKKDSLGERIGNRHHALDAFVVAACSEALLQKVSAAYQRKEQDLLRPQIPAPGRDCPKAVSDMLEAVFPSRAERGKIAGALHEDTLRGIHAQQDEQGRERKFLYLRTPVSKLKVGDLDKIKDAHRCEKEIIAPLRAWLALSDKERADPKNWPRSTSKGDPIYKVRLCTGAFTSGVELPRGNAKAQASSGEMWRTDVFIKNGKYYLVPVYKWQAAQGFLPDRAIVAHKHEDEWIPMDEQFAFCFSLYPNNYVVAKKKTETREGYFVRTHRGTGSITLSSPYDNQHSRDDIGARTLLSLEKYRVDRLGRRHRVVKEKRVPPPRRAAVADNADGT